MRSSVLGGIVVVACAFSVVACGGEVRSMSNTPIADAGSADLIACGSGHCRIGNGEACCLAPGASAPACSTSCTVAEVDLLRCDGPEDCPGKMCCSKIMPSGFSEAACRDRCEAGNGLTICHSNSDCTKPGANTCCPLSANLRDVGVCDSPSGAFCAP